MMLPNPPINLLNPLPKNPPILPESSLISKNKFISGLNLSTPKNVAKITAIARVKLEM